MNRDKIRAYFILLIYIILVILYHLLGYTGHFGFDDIHYAELAADLLKGSVNYEDHYAYRFPVVFFTAFFYWIFGISDFSSSLPALMVTIIILIIVFKILREQGARAIIIGLSLCTFSNWFLFYSDKLMPDIYVALSVIWALAIIHHYKYKSNKRKTALSGFLFAFSLLFGFMSKGTIVLVLPLLLFLFISDIIKKRDLKFWGYSLISGIGLLIIYLFVIWILTGEVLKRFEVIADNSYLNLCSYDQQSLSILLKRVFLGFFELSIFQSLATGFIFVFAYLFQRKGLRYFKLEDSFSFFLVSAMILFLSANFMTISSTSYAPMCLDPRHYLFLVPVVAIPASKIIADYIESKQAAFQIIIALFCITLISFFLQGSTFWKLYLPLFGLFTIYFFTGIKNQFQHLFIILFAAILLLVPMDMISYAQRVKYRKQRELVVDQVLENNKECTIITNEVQKRLLSYYGSFEEEDAMRFLSYEEFEADTAIDGKKLMLLNWYTRYLSGLELSDLPYFARNISPLNKIVFESKDPDLSIYEMSELHYPDKSENPLLYTFNDFENPVPFWNQNNQDFSREIKYAGVKSNQVIEYSATFEYPLDSLLTTDTQSLLIQCSLYCYAEDKTESTIIISFENGSDTYFWKAHRINRYLKAYSNWWPLTFDVTIPQKELKSGSMLKVYVWNNDSPEVYIDNFRINIFGIKVL
jgi:4-amino-4-deoxy-L-arabinose transferase-like glycosyltransferase